MSQRAYRTHLFKLLFQVEFRPLEPIEDTVSAYVDEQDSPIPEDMVAKLTAALIDLLAKQAEIDELIERYAKGWSISRIGKAELAILRLCIYEMRFAEGVPEGVAINEAVELAKEYADEKAPVFINGILGEISRNEQ